MNFLRLHNLPRQVYHAFIKDGRRLYRLLPANLRPGFWVVFATQFFSALIETCTLLVISLFAVSIASPETAVNHPFVRAVLALVPPLRDWCAEPRRLIIFTCLLMAAFIFFKVSLATLVARNTAVFSENVSLHIGRETLRRYLSKDYFWHISPQSAAVIHKFGQRTQLTQYLITLLALYSNVFCCLALFTSLLVIEPRLTLALIAIFGLGSLSLYLFVRRRLDRAGQKANTLALAESADRLTLTQGLREVLIYGRQEVFSENMTATIAQSRPAHVALNFYGHLPAAGLEFIGFSSIAFITAYMLIRGAALPVIMAKVSLLMLTAWRVLPAVNRTLGQAVALRGLRPAAHTCLELLENFIAEEPRPRPAPDPNFQWEKSLALEEAGFRYPGGQVEEVLTGLSLTIRRGERVGLIGPSGSGKSTLALLLTGLVSPQTGRFLVDGRQPSPAALAAYIRQVGFVPQTPLLLTGTVADNVAFSQWGEAYDREAVALACRQAAMDFVFQHPLGLNQRLAAGGHGLSGGQAQRVAIARALFAGPRVIIFDEATSALDQASENLITEAIARLPAGITVVIIAHRLTTVENCDRLFWLESGRIKAEGPPAEILPRYREAMQSRAPASGRPRAG